MEDIKMENIFKSSILCQNEADFYRKNKIVAHLIII